MTDAQRETLKRLCDRYDVEFHEEHYTPQFDLPDGYVAGWIGGSFHSAIRGTGVYEKKTIYVGVSPEGEASS